MHTRSAILAAPVDGTNTTDIRTRVDSFYPSVCLDVDEDGDGVPDTLDVRHSGEDSDDSAGNDVDHRCQPCNRGPGKAGDFRLRVEGQDAELDRGRVFTRAGDGTLTVPSPDGAITITVPAGIRVDDGVPSPGSDIRVKGVVGDGVRSIVATEVKVLCQGPQPVDDDQVPPGSQPVPTDPPPDACAPRDFRCTEKADCCAGLVCADSATGDRVCGPIP